MKPWRNQPSPEDRGSCVDHLPQLRTATLFRFDFEKPEWTGTTEVAAWKRSWGQETEESKLYHVITAEAVETKKWVRTENACVWNLNECKCHIFGISMGGIKGISRFGVLRRCPIFRQTHNGKSYNNHSTTNVFLVIYLGSWVRLWDKILFWVASLYPVQESLCNCINKKVRTFDDIHRFCMFKSDMHGNAGWKAERHCLNQFCAVGHLHFVCVQCAVASYHTCMTIPP